MTEVKLEILKDLIQSQESPCTSIYMSTKAVRKGEFKKLEIGFKNLLQEVEEKLKNNWDFKKREIEEFLNEAYKLAADSKFWQEQKEGLAVFVSKDRFDYFKLEVDTYDKTHVSYDFNLKQLISEFQNEQSYYLLALSPNHNRLYQVSRNSIEKVEAVDLPSNIEDFLNLDYKASEKHQTVSTAGGSTVFHGQGGAADDDNEDLISYLKEIDDVINLKLKGEDSYLVIAADDSVFSLYKNINNYDKLLDENLSGNAEHLNKKELRERSWNLIEPELNEYLKDIKNKYLELKTSEKASNKMEDIIEAANYGKIDTLLINKKAEKEAAFIAEESKIKNMKNNKDYDLFNYAAVQTINNGGTVYSLKKEEMPENENILAIYRY